MKNVVFLIGFMGAGKSFLGEKLAAELDYNFLDSDIEIEKESNSSIAGLFTNYGEVVFRTREKQWLQELNVSRTVVALGGGTPCYNQNMDLIREKGISIYLEASVNCLVERLSRSTNRPLIQNFQNQPKELRVFIATELNKRMGFYKRANYIVSTEQETEKIVEQLLKIIR